MRIVLAKYTPKESIEDKTKIMELITNVTKRVVSEAPVDIPLPLLYGQFSTKAILSEKSRHYRGEEWNTGIFKDKKVENKGVTYGEFTMDE